MLRLMLNNHLRLAIPHETVFITQFHRKLQEYGDLANAENRQALLKDIAAHPLVVRGQLIPDKDAVLTQQLTIYAGLIDAIMKNSAGSQGKLRWGHKTPSSPPTTSHQTH